MKHLKQIALCLLLTFSLVTSAFAAEVPDSLVVENLNGQQRMVKTYVLSPETDPETLKEPSFDYDGFTYTWAYTTKDEKEFLETKAVVETVTVETEKKDLSVILEQLAPTMAYDDGEFAGELALDHTTLSTEAAGYATGSSTVTATRTIGPLDRNDMSYVPATTVKDGVTLNLSNVDWQIIGTDLVGDALAPASYQAVATYSGKSYHKVATGYITSADYVGEVTRNDVEIPNIWAGSVRYSPRASATATPMAEAKSIPWSWAATSPGPLPRSWPCWPRQKLFRCSCKSISASRSSSTSAGSPFIKAWGTSSAAWMSLSPPPATPPHGARR